MNEQKQHKKITKNNIKSIINPKIDIPDIFF